MPFDNFTIGKDVALNVNSPTGPLVLPVTTTAFEMKPEYKRLDNDSMVDGLHREVALPRGWRGTITLDRRDATVDSFFAAREAGYYAGQNILNASITETITESNGPPTVWLYTKVSLTFEEAGNKMGDEKVTQRIGAFASERRQLA